MDLIIELADVSIIMSITIPTGFVLTEELLFSHHDRVLLEMPPLASFRGWWRRGQSRGQ